MNITEFQKSRFGLFIHWGIYSIPARGEWVRSNEEMKEEDYIPFANEFDPDLFDPYMEYVDIQSTNRIGNINSIVM